MELDALIAMAITAIAAICLVDARVAVRRALVDPIFHPIASPMFGHSSDNLSSSSPIIGASNGIGGR